MRIERLEVITLSCIVKCQIVGKVLNTELLRYRVTQSSQIYSGQGSPNLMRHPTGQIVTFAGITYNYTEIAIPGNSKQYPLSKELAYMFIVRYLASKVSLEQKVLSG